MKDAPAVLIEGPRGCGKTTLAQGYGRNRGYRYLNLDDDTLRDAAEAHPIGFAADLPERVILDGVQRTPSLLRALMTEMDRRRTPGRFLMAGSTRILPHLLLPDARAGRLRILRLHPLSQAERAGSAPHFLDRLFGDGFPRAPSEPLGRQLAEKIAAGGYPAALQAPTEQHRAGWHRDQVAALMARDVPDMARIGALEALPRLLGYAAAKTAGLFNAGDLASHFQLTRPTIRSYLVLLERLFLLERLPAWQMDRVSRLVKTPKLHAGDTGLACALMGVDTTELARNRRLLGQLLETFVFQELRRHADGSDVPTKFSHFRDRDGVEVDLVAERAGGAVAGVEVKASLTVRGRDFRGLRKLANAVGDRFAGGVVLYDGHTSARFGEKLYAVPIHRLWEPPQGSVGRHPGIRREPNP